MAEMYEACEIHRRISDVYWETGFIQKKKDVYK